MSTAPGEGWDSLSTDTGLTGRGVRVCYIPGGLIMDNITHSLVGLALAETGLKRVTPMATVTLVLAANFPDIDIVTGLIGQLVYLEYHRGITHALVAIPILSMLLAAVVYGFSLRQKTGARFLPLSGLSLLGMITHPLLDYLNSYGWRPFLPWDGNWIYGDTAFVIDPWLWLVLGGTLFVTTAKTRRQVTGWIVLFAVMLSVVMFSGSVGAGIKLLWLAMSGCVVGFRVVTEQSARKTQIISTGVLVIMLAYIGLLAALHEMALDRTKELALKLQVRSGNRQTQVSALPTPANPLLWQAVIAVDEAFYLTDLNLAKELPSVDSLARYQRETGDASAIAEARQTVQAQTFLRFARFPVSEVIMAKEQNTLTEVEIRDVRFQNQGARNTFHTRIRLNKNLPH